MSNVEDSLQLLFDRPNEPVITPKGDNKAIFQLTEQFVVSYLGITFYINCIDNIDYKLSLLCC